MAYIDPTTGIEFSPVPPREDTLRLLAAFAFRDDANNVIEWKLGEIEIIDCILHRSSPDGKKRIQIIAATRYGKSLSVAAGVLMRASTKPEPWAIVAGSDAKAKIIMEHAIMLALNSELVRAQLTPATPLDWLRMKRSADRLTFRRKGEIRVFSAEAKLVAETSKSLMGFGAPNVVEDESSLIGDTLHATVMRMLGDQPDNFLVKIGNPFSRNHFLKSWLDGTYYRIFINYHRAINEGRFTPQFIEEMRQEALFEVFYECKFPLEGEIDKHGWLPLLTEEEIKRAFVRGEPPFGNFRLGGDVAGGGRNFSVIVLRAYNVAKVLYKANEPDTMLFVGNVIHYGTNLTVKDDAIFIDKVGVGKGAYDRLAEHNRGIGVNAGMEAQDSVRFQNKRAEMFWRAREWIHRGGKLEENNDWLQLANVKYKVADSSGKLKIMGKEEMLMNGVESPDVADAFALTFYNPDSPASLDYQPQRSDMTIEYKVLDPYARHT
jgi:hypothetical protein